MAIQEAQRRLTEACIPNRLEVVQGDPALEILRRSEESQTDLIVMSSHGRSGPSRWVFGSVTEKVLHASRIPLIVTHRKPGPPEESPMSRDIPALLPPV
jgi:nucleotide-binding universal stress UspA family protein